MAWNWTVENVRNNAGLDVVEAGMLPAMLERLGLRGAGLNVFVRKVGAILGMFRRIDSAKD